MFFPKLIFNDIKHIEKQIDYGKNDEYYWFDIIEDYKSDFEYYETLKITYYCDFQFSTFPFDSHTCNLTLGSKCLTVKYMILSKPIISNEQINTTSDEIIKIKTKNVPFDVEAESIPVFNYTFDDFTYSYVGVHMKFSRNSLGLLIGRFFGPTSIFASLSSLSYSIDIEKVHITNLLLS